MKKITLSIIAIATVASAGGEFVEMTNIEPNYVTAENSNAEISALQAQMATMQNKLTELENRKVEVPTVPVVKVPKHKGTLVKSHVPVLKFSGTHYLGFVNKTDSNDDNTNKFETRRNYLQVKAYMKENPKDYMRITLDTHDSKDVSDTDGKKIISGGESGVRLKYAYLYLDNVLPNTGVEFGQAHRPWIDYEEHNAWNYRSISKVLVEEKNAGHLTNSADRGINFKTKTPYFSSELGVFNGEGYHDEEDGEALSGEWRLTGHVLGTGKKKAKKSGTYANVSFFGQQNKLSNKHGNEDLNWMGLHAVYNQPEFLVAAQYITVDEANADYKGDGYSVNGEYRIAPKWNAIGRYDYFDMDDNSGDKKRALAGITYKYNHNVEFIANYLKEAGSNLTDNNRDNEAIMLTAAVEW
jgi:hypothetical protein